MMGDARTEAAVAAMRNRIILFVVLFAAAAAVAAILRGAMQSMPSSRTQPIGSTTSCMCTMTIKAQERPRTVFSDMRLFRAAITGAVLLALGGIDTLTSDGAGACGNCGP